METTIWIAKFLGPIFLAVSVPMIVTPSRLQETTRRFLADRAQFAEFNGEADELVMVKPVMRRSIG